MKHEIAPTFARRVGHMTVERATKNEPYIGVCLLKIFWLVKNDIKFSI